MAGMSSETIDVLIAGGGIVGLTLALALRQSESHLAVAVVDATPSGGQLDGRASAVAVAARRMLARLGVWDAVAADAQPITDMIVTDSRTDDAVRPVFLTFGGGAADGEPFAFMVPNAALVPALRAAAEAAGVRRIAPESVESFAVSGEIVRATLAGGAALQARLLVAADGVRSQLRDLAGIRTVRWDYPQFGLVATVRHQRPHHGRAEEHFLPGGPFAILPLAGNRASLVWTEKRAVAERLMAADQTVFERELARRFGHHLGPIRAEGARHAYPLGLMLARDFVRPRFALAGDAAHSIHPLAGQGLNLGFRDVAALAETVIDARRLGLDFGAVDVLRRYERWRRFDTLEMALITDGLNRIFSNDNPAVRLVRDLGLGIVDRLPFLKRWMIGEAAGTGGTLPRLLRGEAL